AQQKLRTAISVDVTSADDFPAARQRIPQVDASSKGSAIAKTYGDMPRGWICPDEVQPAIAVEVARGCQRVGAGESEIGTLCDLALLVNLPVAEVVVVGISAPPEQFRTAITVHVPW